MLRPRARGGLKAALRVAGQGGEPGCGLGRRGGGGFAGQVGEGLALELDARAGRAGEGLRHDRSPYFQVGETTRQRVAGPLEVLEEHPGALRTSGDPTRDGSVPSAAGHRFEGFPRPTHSIGRSPRKLKGYEMRTRR